MPRLHLHNFAYKTFKITKGTLPDQECQKNNRIWNHRFAMVCCRRERGGAGCQEGAGGHGRGKQEEALESIKDIEKKIEEKEKPIEDENSIK